MTYDRVSLIDNNGTPNVPPVQLAHNADGQLDWLRRYADLAGTKLVAQTQHGYDQLGRLTSLTHYQSGTVLADYGWTFDAFSRVLTFSSATDGNSSYSYDTTSQLTAADHDYQADEAYSFDANGNRTMSGYSTGENNQLLSDGTFNYTYNAEGSRLTATKIATGEVTEYHWDHRNRLTGLSVRATAGGTITKRIEYVYDVFNRRIAKKLDADNSAQFETVQRWVYHGDHIVLEFDGAGNLTHRYLNNPQRVDHVFTDEQLDPITGALGARKRDRFDIGLRTRSRTPRATINWGATRASRSPILAARARSPPPSPRSSSMS